MELRPEWMGASLLKQRNQSDFSLANEYHGYNWEDRQSGKFNVCQGGPDLKIVLRT